jgi:hypothetical protein
MARTAVWMPPLSLALMEPICPSTFHLFKGSTNCNGCKQLGHITTQSSAECCAFCASKAHCDSWTLNLGHASKPVCYAKHGGTANPGGSSLSGIRVHSPTPAPTQPPTPGSSPAPASAANVLFIVVDDLRPEIGAYGIQHARTPNLDSFARGALLFNRAYVQYSFCAPSRNRYSTEPWCSVPSSHLAVAAS